MEYENEDYKIVCFPVSKKQGDETFEILIKSTNEKKLIGIWDYESLYKEPFLFEIIYQEICESNSIYEVWDTFCSVKLLENYKILDIGAGSGLSGKYIREKSNPETLIALDILPSAKAACLRDYGKIYDDYLVWDLANLTTEQQSFLKSKNFNCITIVSASGGSDDDQDSHDVEINEFKSILDIVSTGGYIVFNIREQELKGQSLIRKYLESYCEKVIEKTYVHRLLFNGNNSNNKVLVYKKLMA